MLLGVNGGSTPPELYSYAGSFLVTVADNSDGKTELIGEGTDGGLNMP